MNSNFKISIVTPSLNQGEYIEDAIISVLFQDYNNFEHIIIDGGSTDGTLNILKKYKHLKWISEPDKGQSDALNKGFIMAKGEIVGWLNADDYFLPRAFKKVIDYYSQHPDADVIYGDFYYVKKDGIVLKRITTIDFEPSMAIYIGPYIPTSGSFFNRRLFQKGLFLDTDFHYSMDGEYLIRLGLLRSKFARVPDFLSCFRYHGYNQSLRWLMLNGEEKKRVRMIQRKERQEVLKRYAIKFSKIDFINLISYKILNIYFQNLYKFRKIISGYYTIRILDNLLKKLPKDTTLPSKLLT